MERPYDDLKRIEEDYLQDLDGLNRLIEDRHEAAYVRKERLQEWVILGHWSTDTCGNFGDCTFLDDRYKPIEVDGKGFTVPPVVARADVFKLFHVESMSVSGMVSCVPPARVHCRECGERWTVKNAHDSVVETTTVPVETGPFVGRTYRALQDHLKTKVDGDHFADWEMSVRNDRFIDTSPHPTIERLQVNKMGWVSVRDWVRLNPEERLERFGRHAGSLPLADAKDPWSYVFQDGDCVYANVRYYTHKRCFLLRKSRESRDYYVQIFRDAGFPDPVTREVPNERCSDKCCMPWQVGQFPFGDIKVGWRSSVISIDWSGLRGSPNLRALFADVESTKWDHGVHANTRELAVEYLGRVKSYLDAGFRCDVTNCADPPSQFYRATQTKTLCARCPRHSVQSPEEPLTFVEAIVEAVHSS